MRAQIKSSGPICQAFVLACVQALGWLYLYVIIEYRAYQGNSIPIQDFGLSSFINAWLVVWFVAWLTAGPISKFLFDAPNKRAILYSGLLVIPIWVLFSLILRPDYHGRPSEIGTTGFYLAKIFYVIGLFGLLPEGRRYSADDYALMFIGLFVSSMLSYWWVARKRVTKGVAIVVLALTLLSTGVKNLNAYGVPTHQMYLTIQAVDLLDAKSPVPYLELDLAKGKLAAGTQEEDESTLILANASPITHFYLPTTQTGLSLPLLPTFPSALSRLQGLGGLTINYPDQASSLYVSGHKDEAYIALGHVLHLAGQDMYSPPHVNNDQHLEKIFNIFGAPIEIKFDEGSYEPWVESQFNVIGNNPQRTGITVPDVSWPPLDALHSNAAATHAEVRIQGSLIKDENNPATGSLAMMFPVGGGQSGQGLQYESDCTQVDDLGACVNFEGVWHISNYGDCRENTGLLGNPSVNENWWKASNYSWESDSFFYLEQPALAFPTVYKNGEPAGGKNLAQLWALDYGRLIARSQEASAGILKAFARTVDPLAPVIEVHRADLPGPFVEAPKISQNGATDISDIYIQVADPTQTEFPVASGVYRLTLKNTDTNTIVPLPSPIPSGGLPSVSELLPGLAVGHYQIDAVDGLGNQATFKFTIIPPSPITVLDDQANIIPDHGFNNATVNAFVAAADGTAVITLKGAFDYDPVIFNPGDEIFAEFTNLDDGAYVAEARDAADVLVGSSTFVLDQSHPGISLRDSQGNFIRGSTHDTTVVVHATDEGSGVLKIVLNPGNIEHPISGSPNSIDEPFTNLAPNNYTATVYDMALNTTSKFFAVSVDPPQTHEEPAPVLLGEFHFDAGVDNLPNFNHFVPRPTGGYFTSGSGGIISISRYGEIGSEPLDFFSSIEGLVVASDGSAYALIGGLDSSSFQPQARLMHLGGSSIQLAADPASNTALQYGSGALAIDPANDHLYATYAVSGDGEVRQAGLTTTAVDAGLNVLSQASYVPSTSHSGQFIGGLGAFTKGNAVDAAGDVWVMGDEAFAGTDNFLALHYGSNLASKGVAEYVIPDLESHSGLVGHSVAGGAEALITTIEDADNGSTYTRWTSEGGFGNTLLLTNFEPKTIIDGNIYLGGFDTNGTPQATKIGSNGALVWNPSYLTLPQNRDAQGFTSLSSTTLAIGSVFFNEEFNRQEGVISTYGPPAPPTTKTSDDGIASVVTTIPETTITKVAHADEAAAQAAVGAQFLTSIGDYFYKIQPSPMTLAQQAALILNFDPTGADMPTVALRRFNTVANVWDAAPIEGQTITDNPDGSKRISGFLGTYSLYGLFYGGVVVDTAPPVTSISFSTPSFVSTGTFVALSTHTGVVLSAVDFSQSSSAPISGVATTYYSVDAPTQPATIYAGPFTLVAGDHVIYYYSTDAAGNAEAVSSRAVSAYDVPFVGTVTPSSAAIGVPITIAGFNFRPRSTTKSKILFDLSTGTITSWTDTTIVGKVPGLSTRTYALTVIGLNVSTQASAAVPFDVIAPRLDSIAPSAGPAGITAYLYGGNFGPLDSTRTRVLFNGTTAQINTWADSVIKVDVPAVATGAVTVAVQRQSLDGATVRSNELIFSMGQMVLSAVDPSTGPTGRVVTITGLGFGPIDGTNTRVRVGSSTATLITWTDTQVTAAVPFLSTGVYSLSLERVAQTSTTFSTFLSYELTPLVVGVVNQSSGPIGSIVTVVGAGYGPSDGTRTRVLFDGSTTTFTTWNDTTIVFRVPGAADGLHAFRFERVARNGGVQRSGDGAFTVATPRLNSVSPSSAPIGAANIVLTGFGFGAKDSTCTRVMFGSTSAVLSTWTDASAKVTVPPMMAPGDYALAVERDSLDHMTVRSSSLTFTVLRPTISTMTPNFGNANALITITGYGFGASLGSKSHVLLNGATVQFTVWNDTTIKWKVPSGVANGTYTVVAVREPTGGYAESNGVPFTVGSMALASFGFSAPASLAAQPDQNFEAGMSLPADEGGRIESVALAAVSVPAGALGDDTELSIKRLRSDGLRTSAADAAKVRAAGEPIEFGPEGTVFNTPVTIELPYDPALTADESKIAVDYYDSLRRVWVELPSVVDRTRHVVTAQTSHFSIYQPMGLAPTSAAQDEFYFRDMYAFPNPSRGGSAVTFRIQPGLADTLELRVYDVAGRKIHASTDFTFLGAVDDGNGKGAQDTYDHVWNVGGVGSGVYTYVIRASRTGQSPIVKSGKAAVIK